MQLYDLKGQTALITGASRGLGERAARALSAAGARVILAARSIDTLHSLANELGNAYPIMMNVADKTSVKQAFTQLEQQGENINICINNAGIMGNNPIFGDDSDEFEKILQTNVLGVWHVTRAVANHMKNKGLPGSIIQIASVAGAAIPTAERSAYASSKAAVAQLTKALVGELSPHHIRINSISPGLFPTDMTQARINLVGETFLRIIPAGFIPDLSDLDGAILFLASHAASRYVTGSCVTIDGGVSWGGISYGCK